MCGAAHGHVEPRTGATIFQPQVDRAHALLASFFVLSLLLASTACSSDDDSASIFLRVLAMSLANYNEVNGRLPYADVTPERASLADARQGDSPLRQPLYSWRVEMVYFLQAWRGEWCPSKSWDDPGNHSLAELSCYFALTDTWRTRRHHVFPDTHIVAITVAWNSIWYWRRAT